MVQVLLFASLAQQAGTQKILMDANEFPASVEEVRKILQHKTGQLKGIENSLVAVNEEYAGLADKVKDGDTVAFIPPVSGG